MVNSVLSPTWLKGRPRFDPWVEKIPWRRKWKSIPVFLPIEYRGQRSLAGYSPWGSKELDTTEWLAVTWLKRAVQQNNYKHIIRHTIYEDVICDINKGRIELYRTRNFVCCWIQTDNQFKLDCIMLTIITIVTAKKIFNNYMQKGNEKRIIMVHHQKNQHRRQ